jgi:hypothetical protein
MRALVVLLALTAALVLGPTALGVDPNHRAAEGQVRSKIIDRTMVCKTMAAGGVRKIGVWATSTVPAQRDPHGRKVFPAARLETGVFGGPTLLAARTGDARGEGGAYFVLNPKLCKPSAKRVLLARRGLNGSRAAAWGEGFECFPTREILVRARALFRTPTRMRRDRFGQLVTEAALREVSFAATSLNGIPLVYVKALDSGKAELFVGRGCVRD